MRNYSKKSFGKIVTVTAVVAALLLLATLVVFMFAPNVKEENESYGTSGVRTNSAATAVSPDSLWTLGDKTYVTADQTAPLSYTDSRNGSGVMLSFTGSDATVTYKNFIDVSENTKSDAFISFMPVPLNEAVGEKGERDCDEIHFTLTDELDETNYITVSIQKGFYDCWTNVSVYYSGSAYPWLAGDWDGNTKATDGGYHACELYKSMLGVLYKGPNGCDWYELPWTLYYDAAEKAIYASNWKNYDFTCQGGGYTAADRSLVLDLDDPKMVGAGNEWGGFKGKRVRLGITVKRLRTGCAQVLVYGVNGTSLAGETVVDRKAPSLESDADDFGERLPLAEVGKPYDVFAVRAFDEVRGNKTDCVTVRHTDPNGTTTDVTGKKSIDVTVGGRHKLTYSVTDDDGNRAEKVYAFDAKLCLNDLKAEPSVIPVSAASVGERIYVPAVYACGGSESGIKTETSVIHAASRSLRPVELGHFVPDVAGVYIIRYSVTDYLGNHRDFDYEVNVTRGKTPIAYFIEDEDFPKAFIGGSPVKLPSVETYDYVTDPAAPTSAELKIEYKYADGEYVAAPGGTFTPDKEKSSVTIRYTAYIGESPVPEKSVSREYQDVAIIRPTDAGSYFIKENVTATPRSTSVEFSATETEISSAKTEFVNVLEASALVQFRIGQETDGTDAGKNNFGFLRVRYTDSLDSSVSVTMDIRKNAQDATKCDLYFRGGKYAITGSFFYNQDFSTPFQIRYKQDNHSFVDFTGARIFIVKTDDSGKAFAGFPSGAVRIKIEMHEIEGASAFLLEMLSNQRFSGSAGVAFTDNMQPNITTAYAVPMSAEYGSKVTVPAARAFDVISPVVTGSLTITAPDGTTVFEGSYDENVTFDVNLYGKYSVVYTAWDASGNERTLRQQINVEDRQKPTLIVSGTLKTKVQVGDDIKIPMPVAHDNLTAQSDIITYVYLITPVGKMTEVAGGQEVKIESAGTYKVLYYAADEAGNAATVEYTFTAEEK